MNNVQILVDLRFKSMMALHQPGAISPTAKSSLDMLTRHIRLLGKFFRALQRFSAAKFTKLPSCDDLVLYYWGQVVQAADASPDMTYGRFPDIAVDNMGCVDEISLRQTRTKRRSRYAS